MLKKTIAASGILAAAATGAILASQPASAQIPAWGGGGCCSSHSGFFHGSHTRNHNWSGNENEGLNHIRLRIHNRNNNIAVARTHQKEDEVNEQKLKDYYGGGSANGNIGAPGTPGV